MAISRRIGDEIERLVVAAIPLLQCLGQRGASLEQGADHPGEWHRLEPVAERLGEDHRHLAGAAAVGLDHRDGVGHPPICHRHPVHLGKFAGGEGNGATGGQHFVHVLRLDPDVLRLAGQGIGHHRIEGDAALPIAMDIEGVFAAAGVPQPVDIYQIAPLGKTQRVEKLRGAGQLGQDVVAAAMLAGEIGQEVGRAGRNTDGKVEGAVVTFDKRIQHAAGKYAAHGATFNNQSSGGCGSIHDKHLVIGKRMTSGWKVNGERCGVRILGLTILTANLGWLSQ